MIESPKIGLQQEAILAFNPFSPETKIFDLILGEICFLDLGKAL